MRNNRQVQIGFLLIMLSGLFIAFQNVIVRIVLFPRLVFGIKMGGWLQPSFGNSLFLLSARMALLVPVLAIMGTIFYPRMWQDLRQMGRAENRRFLWAAAGSGCLLFFSQVAIYIALGSIPTGWVTLIFFTYPIMALLLSAGVFEDRLSVWRLMVSLVIFYGMTLTIPGAAFSIRSNLNIGLGLNAAFVSVAAFALYLVTVQYCTQRLHPVPFSLINFMTNFVLVKVSLTLVPIELPESSSWPILAVTIALAGTTLVGYLLSHFGIRALGAARAGLLMGSGPALTSILAVLILAETLQIPQILGILLICAGAIALIFEPNSRGAAPPSQG